MGDCVPPLSGGGWINVPPTRMPAFCERGGMRQWSADCGPERDGGERLRRGETRSARPRDGGERPRYASTLPTERSTGLDLKRVSASSSPRCCTRRSCGESEDVPPSRLAAGGSASCGEREREIEATPRPTRKGSGEARLGECVRCACALLIRTGDDSDVYGRGALVRCALSGDAERWYVGERRSLRDVGEYE